MWRDLLAESPNEPLEIDVSGWLGRAALDVLVVLVSSHRFLANPFLGLGMVRIDPRVNLTVFP